MRVDLNTFELHNIVKAPDGLRTRKALASLKTPTAGTVYVGGFTIESPFTTEPWHYLFEQKTADATVTLRVLNEEFGELFNYPLGMLTRDPVFTFAVQNNQFMINSPALSAPLYGVCGGGIVTAVKTTDSSGKDPNAPDFTVLDIPNGHICAFGDRMPIAQGNVVYFNDAGVDPRIYVAQNAVSFPGTVYDIFQGPDGALHVFTSSGLYSMPQDALGQGQQVVGFISKVPAIETSRPRNAIASSGFSVVLQKDAIVLISSPNVLSGASQQKIDVTTYYGRRSFSQVIDTDDLRLVGELFPTPTGFLVGFRGRRGFYLQAETRPGGIVTFQWVTSSASAFNVVGTLKTRDGESLHVFKDRIAQQAITGWTDYDGNQVVGVACGHLDLEGEQPIVRHLSTTAAMCGTLVGAYMSGSSKTKTAAALTGEAVLGTAVWGAGTTIAGRQLRSVRTSFSLRATDPNVEVVAKGAGRRVSATLDVIVNGQGSEREDKN